MIRYQSMNHPLFTSIEPLVKAIGATLVDREGNVIADGGNINARSVPLEWEGETIGEVQLPALHSAVSDLMDEAERRFGRPLHSLSREEKQQVVAMLDEWGAFVIRKSVEDVADALRVSRFTVYNYLNRAGANQSTNTKTSEPE